MSEKANPFAKFLSHHRKGDYIFREGDDGDEMYIIQTGRVSIQKVIGGKKTPLTVLEKGDFFGEMSVLERLPRTADAEAIEDADLISINSATFGEMIRSNPEIAVRMLRKYSMRMREFAEQLEAMMVSRDGAQSELASGEGISKAAPAPATPAMETARAYFIAKNSGKMYHVYKDEVLLGRYDSVTGHRPEVDLTEEDINRNVSRRHARLLHKEGAYYVAEEIGSMNGTYLNGKKLTTGVLTPIQDGDELLLCRVPLTFKTSA
ncbi:MAG: cyclic nucleotide-binding domain-containing protein [Vicinamibacteria bacterium]